MDKIKPMTCGNCDGGLQRELREDGMALMCPACVICVAGPFVDGHDVPEYVVFQPRRFKTTAAQRRILSAAAAHKFGRVVGGDPRTREILIDRKWIEVDGYHFGPLFKITDAGREACR